MSDYGTCPKCGGDLVKRNGKYGEFIGCSNFPNCRYIKKGNNIVKLDSELGLCPKCGAPLIKKIGNGRGRYIACSAFPGCNYTRDIKSNNTKSENKIN